MCQHPELANDFAALAAQVRWQPADVCDLHGLLNEFLYRQRRIKGRGCDIHVEQQPPLTAFQCLCVAHPDLCQHMQAINTCTGLLTEFISSVTVTCRNAFANQIDPRVYEKEDRCTVPQRGGMQHNCESALAP